jgi:proton glutamate symport protein
LSDDSAPPTDKAARSFRAYWALAALVVGLVLGLLDNGLPPIFRADALATASFVGTLWLNGLKMTVIPLVITLLVTGVAKSAEAARGGKIAATSVLWIVIVCTVSAIFGALVMLLLTHAFPLAQSTAESLRGALAAVEQKSTGPLPSVADFFKDVIPSNVFAAASDGDVLPLVVFSLFFALALTRISDDSRRAVVTLFEGIADTLLIIIRWVLWIAPLGVFALAFAVGSEAGGAAFAGLGHYIVLVSAVGILWMILAAYPMGIIGGRISPQSFATAMVGPQAVAISTRSSLASLPAMLTASQSIGVRSRVADVALPLAVALFRSTGPAMNVGVPFYIAHWLGLHPSVPQMIGAIAVGAVMSYGAVSLPGEITYISSIAPISLALGVPIAPLALLVAVEMVPDIFRTLGNVTFDVALAAVVDRSVTDPSST